MENDNDVSDKLVDFLDLSGNYVKIKEDKYVFSLLNSEKIIVDEVYKIIDPSYDQAFKILFNGYYELNKINGIQRAKSLIQSLLYKFKGNTLISKLEYIQNEIPEISGKNRNKLRVLDCPFYCVLADKSEYVIDLEIQNYYYDGLDLNALGYGTALRNAYNYPVIIIVLLLKNTENNISFEIKPFKKYANETELKPIDDYVYVFCIDLYYIVDCINTNIEPELGGLTLSKEGKEWIKLLAISRWMNKTNSKETERYLVPKNLSNSKEIKNAIRILESNDNSKLIKEILKEKEYNIIVKNIKYSERINIWINAYLQGKLLDKTIIPFPEVAPEFLIKECKSIMNNKKDCISFLNILIQNNILQSKDIYQILVDKIYK